MKLWLCFHNIQVCLTNVYRHIELKISLRDQSASGKKEHLLTPYVIFETAGSIFRIDGHNRVANTPYWRGVGYYSKISTRRSSKFIGFLWFSSVFPPKCHYNVSTFATKTSF